MSEFITSIKTTYSNLPVNAGKEEFVSQYKRKNGRKVITGANRSEGKKFTSQLMK